MQLAQVLPAVVLCLSVAAEGKTEGGDKSKRGILANGLSYGAGVPVQAVEYINRIPVANPVPLPQPVPVPLPVHVPQAVPVQIPIEVPVYRTVKIPIERPVPYTIEKPYPVEIIEKIPVPIPRPYPVPYTIYKTKHHFKEIIVPKHWW